MVSLRPRNELGYSTRAVAQPKFGFLQSAFMKLEANPLGDTLLKDVFGFNLPRLIFTRTWKERLDLATSEFSNTAITIFGSLLLPRLLRIPASKISKVLITQLEGETLAKLAPKTKLARLAVAFGFMFPFAGAFWSASFFRNWLTLKRTKSANFDAMIGLETAGENKKAKRSVEEETRYQRNMVLKINAIGAVLGLVSLVGLALKAKKFNGPALSKSMEWLYQKFDLTGKANFFGKGADQISSRLSTFTFWLAPAYFGWLQSARNKNELKEQTLKMSNSFLWFSFFNPLVVDRIAGRIYRKEFKQAGLYQRIPKEANSLWNKFYNKVILPLRNPYKIPTYDELKVLEGSLKKELTHMRHWKDSIGFLITLTMLGITPQILNMILTRRRFDREHHRTLQHAALKSPDMEPDQPSSPTLIQPVAHAYPQFPILRSPLPTAPIPTSPWLLPPVNLPSVVQMPLQPAVQQIPLPITYPIQPPIPQGIYTG